jgi:gamma-glutamyltranspeptidase/glutathione hydrolase
VQTLVNILDMEYGAQQAVDDPRVHWDGTRVHLEGGMPGEVEARLRATGRRVQAWSVTDLFFGGVQVVSRTLTADGIVFDGAGDPRRGGAAMIA